MKPHDSTASLPLPADSRRFGGGLDRVTLWAFGILVTYVLSTGPAVKLVDHGIVPGKFVLVFYAPLGWLVDNCEPVEQFFDWYLDDVWGRQPYIRR